MAGAIRVSRLTTLRQKIHGLRQREVDSREMRCHRTRCCDNICLMTAANRHMLLSTLAGAKRLRRGVALLACVGILGWTLLAATHWHDPFEGGGPSQHEAAPCLLCLGTATGAPPPGISIL